MATPFLNFIAALAIIIVVAKASGYLSTRIGQPAVLGELLAGIILGPTVLDMLHIWPVFAEDEHLAESIQLMAEIGVLMLMMLAGLELDLKGLLGSGKTSGLAGTLGVFVPLVLGYGTARLFGLDNTSSFVMALSLAATSVSISAQTLMELKVLRSRVGLALLGAAVFDDILVILLLSVTSIFIGGAAGGIGEIAITLLRIVLFLVIASALGFFLLPRLTLMINTLPISQGTLAFALVAMLLYAWSAEAIGGIAAITGAFLVGLFLSRSQFHSQLESGVSALAYGFFVPVFFVSIGLEVNLRSISGSAWIFAIVITIVAILSKIAGSGLGAKISGFTNLESLQLGIGMVSRGEVGLIVAAFALSNGLMSQNDFSIAVFMVIIATLVTPPMLRASFKERSTPSVVSQAKSSEQ
ncbi:MAG: cation:proton antiporter [Candidatus Promineifilaceae bacterium]|nr:cation:proton antiporter [Candidatus Promineifilaceae bacterium]